MGDNGFIQSMFEVNHFGLRKTTELKYLKPFQLEFIYVMLSNKRVREGNPLYPPPQYPFAQDPLLEGAIVY